MIWNECSSSKNKYNHTPLATLRGLVFLRIANCYTTLTLTLL